TAGSGVRIPPSELRSHAARARLHLRRASFGHRAPRGGERVGIESLIALSPMGARAEGSVAGAYAGAEWGLPLQEAGGVLEVDLSQHRLGEADAVDLPAALDGGGALEVLVAGLEVAPGGGEEALLVG